MVFIHSFFESNRFARKCSPVLVTHVPSGARLPDFRLLNVLSRVPRLHAGYPTDPQAPPAGDASTVRIASHGGVAGGGGGQSRPHVGLAFKGRPLLLSCIVCSSVQCCTRYYRTLCIRTCTRYIFQAVYFFAISLFLCLLHTCCLSSSHLCCSKWVCKIQIMSGAIYIFSHLFLRLFRRYDRYRITAYGVPDSYAGRSIDSAAVRFLPNNEPGPSSVTVVLALKWLGLYRLNTIQQYPSPTIA